jgi:hypothetical protein
MKLLPGAVISIVASSDIEVIVSVPSASTTLSRWRTSFEILNFTEYVPVFLYSPMLSIVNSSTPELAMVVSKFGAAKVTVYYT